MIELQKIIMFEIGQIDKLIGKYGILFEELKSREPNFNEIDSAAIATHSFYNGVEKIFELIAKQLDKFTPESGRTHRELLYNVHVGNDIRPAVIDEETYFILDEYLKFRHFFRHSYAFLLDWEQMKELAYNLSDTWKTVRGQLLDFVDFLENIEN